jgi:hypothetical protein
VLWYFVWRLNCTINFYWLCRPDSELLDVPCELSGVCDISFNHRYLCRKWYQWSKPYIIFRCKVMSLPFGVWVVFLRYNCHVAEHPEVCSILIFFVMLASCCLVMIDTLLTSCCMDLSINLITFIPVLDHAMPRVLSIYMFTTLPAITFH